MRQQWNTLQTKEQYRNSQEQLNEEGIGNLPEKEVRVMIERWLKILGKKKMEAQIKKIKEMFNQGLEDLKKKTEMKNTLEEINSRINEAE